VLLSRQVAMSDPWHRSWDGPINVARASTPEHPLQARPSYPQQKRHCSDKPP
jgi:hypothetical protein